MNGPRTAQFEKTKAYDVLMAAPLILFYAASVVGTVLKFAADLQTSPAWFSHLKIVAHASYLFYGSLLVALVIFRRMPVAKSRGLAPRIVALLGANLLLLPAILPGGSLSPPETAASLILTGGATMGEILILFWLGRSFSILPEARQLVTRGPYSVIRHPLYLTGIIASFGTMLLFPNIWSVLIVLAADALQIARLHFEEHVLRDAFPEFAEYATRTWRLLPGIY